MLKALYMMTGDEFWQEELQHRNELVKNMLPVYAVKGADGSRKGMMLRACAPHPYYVDIYPTIIELLDNDGKVIQTESAQNRFVENAYMYFDIPNAAVKYRLCGKMNAIKPTLIAEGDIIDISVENTNYNQIFGTWMGTKDAVIKSDGKILIQPSLSERLQGKIEFTPNIEIGYGREIYVIVKIKNNSNETMPMTSAIVDANGTNMWRVILPCKPGENLQILNYLGFKEHKWPLTHIKNT